jgi:hypothetical protein
MRCNAKHLATLCLSAAIMAPVGALAVPRPQDEHERREEAREHRVYDAERKEYRNWDRHEDEAYRHWFEARHEAYVDYRRLDKKRQREYWKWRHEAEEHEHR